MSGEQHLSAELRACSLLREVVDWDRVAVVVARDIDTRAALRGSDAVLERYCDLQQTLVQGPSLDAFTTGAPVLVDDLHATPFPWPLLGASMSTMTSTRTASTANTGLPVRSMAVMPLLTPTARSRAEAEGGWFRPVLGVLIAGRDRLEPFTGDAVSTLAHLAGVVAALLVHRAGTGELAAADLDPSDDLAVVVGMLEERLGTGLGEAMTRMRVHAFASGCTIHDVARAVVAGRTRLEELAGRS